MAVLAGCLLPVALVGRYIARFGVNALYQDEWDIVPYFERLYTHTLTVEDLVRRHNEHRFLFPRLWMLVLGNLTDLNTVAWMASTAVLLTLGAAALLSLHLKLSGRSLRQVALFIPAVWLLLTFRQAHNLLWGWQVSFALCTVGFYGALALLLGGRLGPGRLLGAAACAMVSAFSFAPGLLAWPVLLVTLLYQR